MIAIGIGVAAVAVWATVGGGDEGTFVHPNAADTSVAVVRDGADLAIDQVTPTGPVLAGDAVELAVTIANTGPADAEEVSVVGVVPPGTVASFGPRESRCVPTADGFSCNLGRIFDAVSFDVILEVPADHAPGRVSNTVTVSSSTSDPDGANNTHSADFAIAPPFRLSVDTIVSEIDVDGDRTLNEPGDIAVLWMTATNVGNAPLSDVSITNDSLSSIECTGQLQPTDLDIGEALVCTGTYVLTQDDLDSNGGGDSDIDNRTVAESAETGQVEGFVEAAIVPPDPETSCAAWVVGATTIVDINPGVAEAGMFAVSRKFGNGNDYLFIGQTGQHISTWAFPPADDQIVQIRPLPDDGSQADLVVCGEVDVAAGTAPPPDGCAVGTVGDVVTVEVEPIDGAAQYGVSRGFGNGHEFLWLGATAQLVSAWELPNGSSQVIQIQAIFADGSRGAELPCGTVGVG